MIDTFGLYRMFTYFDRDINFTVNVEGLRVSKFDRGKLQGGQRKDAFIASRGDQQGTRAILRLLMDFFAK